MALGQIVGGIAQLSAARQMKRSAQDMIKKAGTWEDYQVSEQAKQMLGEAQARRGAQMPGMGIAQAQMAGQQASLLGAAQRGSTGGANFMALAAALGAQGQQAGLGLAQQQAQYNEAQQQALNQARGVMMGEEKARFQNQLGRFQYLYGMGQQLGQAARETKAAGIAGLGSGVENLALSLAGGGVFKQGGLNFFNNLMGYSTPGGGDKTTGK
jgi:hypothetical protein